MTWNCIVNAFAYISTWVCLRQKYTKPKCGTEALYLLYLTVLPRLLTRLNGKS